MKYLTLILVGILALGFAQEGEKVRVELERTDQLIEQARPVIERAGSGDAAKVFAEAVAVQQRAWDSFRGKRYGEAGIRTTSARQLVERALKLAKFDPERISEEIRRTADLMNEAGPVIVRSGAPKALDLWRLAQSEQETARRSFDARQYLVALKFTLAARLHTKTALEIIRRAGDPERVRLELERTDMLLARARQKLAQSENARLAELLAKATGWQDQAWQALRSGQPFVALKLTLSARDLLLRAWEMARGPDRELVEQAIGETDRLVEKWSGVITERGPDEARSLARQATEHQATAKKHFAAAELRPALSETTIARRLMARAIELAFGRKATDKEIAAGRDLVAAHGLPILCRSLYNANEFITVY